MKNIKDDMIAFFIVIDEIWAFLELVFEAMGIEGERHRQWNSGLSKWLNLKGGNNGD